MFSIITLVQIVKFVLLKLREIIFLRKYQPYSNSIGYDDVYSKQKCTVMTIDLFQTTVLINWTNKVCVSCFSVIKLHNS